MNKAFKRTFEGAGPYLWTALFIILCFVLLSRESEGNIRFLMQLSLAFCGGAILLLLIFQKLALRHVIAAVIVAGIILRTGYMLYTPFLERAHDMMEWDSGSGHYQYMFGLYQSWSLPDSNFNQFYHPPLQHVLQVIVAKIAAWFQPGESLDALFEAAKLIPLFSSCAILLLTRSLVKTLALSETGALIAAVAVAFHPSFFLLSAFLNNDALMLMFFMAALLYTIRYYYRPGYKNILCLALSIGLAMMSKVSGVLIVPFTGIVLIIVLAQKLREKKLGQTLAQYGVFAAVSLPLGLWYPIRNLILFDQPLGYVPSIGRGSNLYCGDRTFAERFLSFPIEQLLNPLYCQPRGDYNLWLYIVKCSVFGEYAFDQQPFFAGMLTVSNLILMLLSLAAMVYVMAAYKQANPFARFGLFFVWLLLMVSFVVFNIRYPFGCTMDFRYIMPTCIIGAIYLGMAVERLNRKGWQRVFVYAAYAAVALFAASSVMFYAL